MEKLKCLLVCNRGEIACRTIKTAKALEIRTISIYTAADAASLHVSQADEAVLLVGTYTDGDEIIEIAKANKCDSLIPGYGFLSENADFARSVGEAGLVWVGPSPEAIEAFGVKHVARELAEKAGVPIVPGTKGLVDSVEDALSESERIGYPVMLKATSGGGGMGLVVCKSKDEVKEGFKTVQSRGQALFKNSGLFIERYIAAGRHIEVQVFGNGNGKAIHFGERECSIQRRHQKVIEECPSPFVAKHPGLREKLGATAVSLAESVKYGSAGTVEYIVDDTTGDYFFLEMNTRLQVEHGITELCYSVDLVELMLKQADAQLCGKSGLGDEALKSMQPAGPRGCAIEARVYAENPVRDYAPSPGLLQRVEFSELDNSRIDTWVFTGSTITPNYDPLIAKVMNHAKTREAARKGMDLLLTRSTINGPPTNLGFLASIMRDERFIAGNTWTSFLDTFEYTPAAIDVISGGAYTLVQDLIGRPSVGKGIPHSGAMDPVALSIGNMLVGNDRSTEGLEVTLSGPELRFLGPAVIALTGAPMEFKLDGQDIPMWTRKHVKAGQRVKIGKTTGGGCRAYLAVHGGFTNVADYFGSKSTSPLVALGGYQGRALAPGDLLEIKRDIASNLGGHPSIPEHLRPSYPEKWELMAMPGPHEEGYFTPEDIDMLYNNDFKVSHNASRSGIRLVPAKTPQWARKDGGEGGSHPSNLVEFGYPLGTLNWTGDDPCLFPSDQPSFGGFVCSTTVIRADWWKMGQLKAGNTMKYTLVSLEEALLLRQDLEHYLEAIVKGVQTNTFDNIEPLGSSRRRCGERERAVIWERAQEGSQPLVRYRQGGDDHLLVEYGNEEFNLNYRCRVTALEKALRAKTAPSWLRSGLINTVGCCTTLLLFYDGSKLPRRQLVEHLQALEDKIGDLSSAKVPCRRFRLPISFESKEQDQATARYMETQRPAAPYLPDNLSFVAKNNAFSPEELKNNLLNGELMAVVIGFYSGNTVSLPVDPRQRMSSPKTNPSRARGPPPPVFTPEGTFGWGGSCGSIYPVDSPGGYMLLGRTIPCFDALGYKKGFSEAKPWLFEDFDILTFYQVSEDELNRMLGLFRSGRYSFDFEDVEFDMAEHNKLLLETASEVKEIRAAQAEVQKEMIAAENASLAKWREDKLKNKPDDDTIDALLADPAISVVEAPMGMIGLQPFLEASANEQCSKHAITHGESYLADNSDLSHAIWTEPTLIIFSQDANVWKVLIEEQAEVKAKQTLVIIEAMKLEMAVNAADDVKKAKIEKLLVQPGETVKAGDRIALLRHS